jgi:SAM-dependent methyltransferase
MWLRYVTTSIKKAIRAALPRYVKDKINSLRRKLESCKARMQLLAGVRPLADQWGRRGKPVHRHYLEQFLSGAATDVHGVCLEFQEDSYTTLLGGERVTKLDILNLEANYPGTTIVADLTKRNSIPSETFDCIICTYVLHIIYEKEKAVSELFRILKPGGVLFISVPNITVHYQLFPELWRFTVGGLHTLLSRYFEASNVVVQGYGNSLTAAGEIRGLALDDFTKSELDYHDPRYSLIVCARAVKSVDYGARTK